jgi:N utilization substance protein B
MRRRSRECALQLLYEFDVGRAPDRDGVIERYFAALDKGAAADRDFAERLVRGVLDARPDLDARIGSVSDNWRPERMGVVDRNLLRIAAYEILHCPDIPRAVSINEALEIAKRFGTETSAAFINGILDQL